MLIFYAYILIYIQSIFKPISPQPEKSGADYEKMKMIIAFQ